MHKTQRKILYNVKTQEICYNLSFTGTMDVPFCLIIHIWIIILQNDNNWNKEKEILLIKIIKWYDEIDENWWAIYRDYCYIKDNTFLKASNHKVT